MVKILLDHGADPNAQNSVRQNSMSVTKPQKSLVFSPLPKCLQDGSSSLPLAVYEHHTEIAMLLVHRGAEVNIVEEVNASGNHACTAVSNNYFYVPCRMEIAL